MKVLGKLRPSKKVRPWGKGRQLVERRWLFFRRERVERVN